MSGGKGDIEKNHGRGGGGGKVKCTLKADDMLPPIR